MTAPAPATLPRTAAVLAEQLRFLGLALRRWAAAGLAVPLALLALALLEPPLSYAREVGWWFAVLGFAAPFAAWRTLRSDGALWTLPVEHRRHALVGVAAGWCWLMAAAAALLAWLVALVLLTDGRLVVAETRLLLAGAAAAPERLAEVAWRTPWWQWAIPFTAATVAYLLGSALVLATRHPWRWAAGALLAVVLALTLSGAGGRGDAGPRDRLLGHRYGVETLVLGGPDGRTSPVTVAAADGRPVRAWRELPTFDRWAAATLLWTAAGALALWLATRRLRERDDDLPGASA